MRLWQDFVNLMVSRYVRLGARTNLQLEQPGTAPLQGNTLQVAKVGRQPAPAAKTVATTLTAAELLAGLLTANQGGAAAANYQLPTAANMEAGWAAQKPELKADDSFDFTLINISAVAAEDITITTGGAGWTLVGNMVVESNEATAQKGPNGTFRVRRTGAATFTIYRIAG